MDGVSGIFRFGVWIVKSLPPQGGKCRFLAFREL